LLLRQKGKVAIDGDDLHVKVIYCLFELEMKLYIYICIEHELTDEERRKWAYEGIDPPGSLRSGPRMRVFECCVI
jgi:hypothetical protein